MTDTTRTPEDKDDDLRPIPDGGLATSLPDWLKEPPSWTKEQTSVAVLPPDTSPIDPRTLVRDEDLPEWLRAIAQREAEPITLPDQEPEPDALDSVDASSSDPEQLIVQTIEPPKPEWLLHSTSEPVIPADSTVDMQRWLTSGEVTPEKRKLFSDPVLAAFILAAAIIIAVALYLIYS
jgi:hypothetical protein